jgi:hypothetical protein
MEMWTMPLQALVKTLSLLRNTPVFGFGQVGGDAGEANGGDGFAGRPAKDQGAVAGRPGDAGGEAGQVVLVLVFSEENQAQ